jgi:hypothetical protein
MTKMRRCEGRDGLNGVKPTVENILIFRYSREDERRSILPGESDPRENAIPG